MNHFWLVKICNSCSRVFCINKQNICIQLSVILIWYTVFYLQLITKYVKMWMIILMLIWYHIQKTVPNFILVKIWDGREVISLIWWTVLQQQVLIPNWEYATILELCLIAIEVSENSKKKDWSTGWRKQLFHFGFLLILSL